MNLGGLDPLVGVLGGIQIWDWSDADTRERAYKINPVLRVVELAYNEVYPSRSTNSLIVGELAHFLYVLHQRELDRDCRRAVSRKIKLAAERILGEPYELGDSRR